MKIGNLDLGECPVLLAPMEDVSTRPFRLLCRHFGADLLYTEFVSSDALVRSVEKTFKKMEVLDEERPIAIQIYGKDIDAMVGAAKIAEEANPNFIDINFGCPVKKIATKGAGSGMLKDIPAMLKMTEAIVKAVDLPVTVKTRIGWDEDSRDIVTIAEQLQDVGIQALTIHGRTRCQMYKGEADWEYIGAVKNNPRMHIPIIGNGDITNHIVAKERFDTYGVDAIMVGRGAIGKPWIFRDIKNYLKDGSEPEPVSFDEQLNILRMQVKSAMKWLDEKRGILHMRRHMAAMFKGLPHFRDLRIMMLQADTMEELEDVWQQMSEKYGNN
ncbi:tRNA-U20-dihydrouridine synthase [Balneicella halophila]|uniref:tRNA-dihydrouridine synthase n=1 Tax=Balneicella halophila TaxID=1537566 RepID=A0A7L4UPQ4_BALHA|nr:tRNA dihydrouridine synthase DusB [Balneicella halophila]PVX50786.1 tRNA-U20-dihydrouridine synthase [Balneicella halophila]